MRYARVFTLLHLQGQFKKSRENLPPSIQVHLSRVRQDLLEDGFSQGTFPLSTCTCVSLAYLCHQTSGNRREPLLTYILQEHLRYHHPANASQPSGMGGDTHQDLSILNVASSSTGAAPTIPPARGEVGGNLRNQPDAHDGSTGYAASEEEDRARSDIHAGPRLAGSSDVFESFGSASPAPGPQPNKRRKVAAAQRDPAVEDCG